jgi:nucleotide-binding universal stress UspA family protein
MKWLIETNLGPRSAGAIAFGHWLGRRYLDRQDIVAIHVAPKAAAPLGRRDYHGTGSRGARVRATVRAKVEPWRGPRVFDEVLVRENEDPARVVQDVAEQPDFDVLVVGRVGASDGRSLINLGRTTRRVLGAMPSPVLVVPPDLDVGELDHGPIVVGVTPDEAAASAAHFCRRLARVLGLPLQLVHVVPPSEGIRPAAVDPAVGFAVVSASRRTAAERGAAGIEGWIRAQGLQELPLRIESGDPVEVLMSVGTELGATILACGSHEHSWAARLLGTSVASHLAAHADRPVLAVPVGYVSDVPAPSPDVARAEAEGMVSEVAKVSGV